MHNSSACKEWKIRRHKRHDDDGRRSDRSLVSGFPPSVYWLLTSIRKRTISSPVAEFVSQESWERARNTNDDDCCQCGMLLRRLATTNAVCCIKASEKYVHPKWHSLHKARISLRMYDKCAKIALRLYSTRESTWKHDDVLKSRMTSSYYYRLQKLLL